MEKVGTGTLAEIRKEAAAWLVEMDVDPERWDRQAFVTWLKLSPSHMDEFQHQAAFWLALHDVKAVTIDELLIGIRSHNVTDLPLTKQTVQRDRRVDRRSLWFAGVAASALFAASVWLISVWEGRPQVLTTAIGEQRAVRLADRSVVHLNTNTRVEIHFTDTGRDLKLTQGEALFIVERDTIRPFRVHADDVQLEALGTQFNVRRRPADTIVSVVEGTVALVGSQQAAAEVRSPGTPRDETYEAGQPAPPGTLAVVRAGEQIRVHANGSIEERRIENIAVETAWRQRQLVFSDTPLADVAVEVARYNVIPQLTIEGEALNARKINGVFAADDPDSLIEFLASDTKLSVTRRGDVVVIRAR